MQQQATTTVLERLIEEKGLRKTFVAEGCGFSPSLLTLILKQERRLNQQGANAIALRIGVPAWVFYDGERLLINQEGNPTSEEASA